MEHSNSISSPGPTTVIRCLCGKNAVLKQSKTSTNPARWFWSCPDRKNHKDNSGCKYFAWQDEVNPIKSVSSIIQMLDCDLQQGQYPEIESPFANQLLSKLELMEDRMSKVEATREHQAVIQHLDDKFGMLEQRIDGRLMKLSCFIVMLLALSMVSLIRQ